MKNDERFAVWIAGAVLRAGAEDIQAEVLDEIANTTDASTSLDAKLTEIRTATRKPGDFGMELIGSLLIPVLIEAGKLLWSAYVKSLAEKSGKELAGATVDQVKKLAQRSFGGDEQVLSIDEFERLTRQAAVKEGMPQDQIESLILAIRSEKMTRELASHA